VKEVVSRVGELPGGTRTCRLLLRTQLPFGSLPGNFSSFLCRLSLGGGSAHGKPAHRSQGLLRLAKVCSVASSPCFNQITTTPFHLPGDALSTGHFILHCQFVYPVHRSGLPPTRGSSDPAGRPSSRVPDPSAWIAFFRQRQSSMHQWPIGSAASAFRRPICGPRPARPSSDPVRLSALGGPAYGQQLRQPRRRPGREIKQSRTARVESAT
jgi:hypothetical protein